MLPYSLMVGEEGVKRALEWTFIAPRIGGVLMRGDRGTGKSTLVRAFARMVHGDLPVTLPINATDDRVVGGYKIDELMLKREPVKQPGLLEQASEKGLLYIDEVNLLDDHIINPILDAASTGHLSIQYESRDDHKELSFVLVGTMNPEEGLLRPQLLDRFGLIVDVAVDRAQRSQILEAVLALDEALGNPNSTSARWLREGEELDRRRAQELQAARARLYEVAVGESIAKLCADLADGFDAAGHRGDYVLALTARAQAAMAGAEQIEREHVATVARMALQHRRGGTAEGGHPVNERSYRPPRPPGCVCPTAAASSSAGRVEIVAACMGRRQRLIDRRRRCITWRSTWPRRSRARSPYSPWRQLRRP
jgi:magnesium chelatase subunit I